MYRNIISSLVDNEVYLHLDKKYKFPQQFKEFWINDNLSAITDYNFLKILEQHNLIKQVGPSCPISLKQNFDKIHIQLNNSCMCKCGHCYLGESGNKSLSFNEVKKIIDDFILEGIHEVDYSGGEPTLNKDFVKIIQYAKSQGLKQMLFTNGYFSENLIPHIVSYIDIVQISIDGNETYHNFFRKNSQVFKKALKTLFLLQDTKVKLIISMSVVKENVQYIDYVQALAKKFGASFRFAPPAPVGNSKIFTNEYYVSLLASIKNENVHKNLNLPELTPTKAGCSALKNRVYIDVNKDIYPCPLLSEKNYKIVNIDDTPIASLSDNIKYKNICDNLRNIVPLKNKYVFFCPVFIYNLPKNDKYFGLCHIEEDT